MRVQHWIAPVFGVLCMISGSRVSFAEPPRDPFAQAPSGSPSTADPSPSSSLFGVRQTSGISAHSTPTMPVPPTPISGAPSYVDPQMGGYAPGAFGAAGYPDGATAWPELSPYADPAYSQHYVENGLWHRDTNNDRKYFFSLEALVAKLRRPGRTVVGNAASETYLEEIFPDLMMLDAQLASDYDTYHFNYYNPVDLGVFDHNLITGGIRGRWGYFNPDDSGLVLEMWWHADTSDQYNAEEEIATHTPLRKDLLVQVFAGDDPVLPTDLIPNNGLDSLSDLLAHGPMNLNGIQIDDGTPNGATVPYDLKYVLKVYSEAMGTGLHWYLTPAYRKGSFKIRPLAGVRYLQVREGFRFIGQDSGTLYDGTTDLPLTPDVKLQPLPNGIDENGDQIIDDSGSGTDEMGVGGGDAILYAQFSFESPFNASLENRTRSHLAGPEIGLRYDLGGDSFLVWGQTKFSVAANHERVRLNGNNIGNANRQQLLVPTPQDPHPNRFSGEEEHTHVSPIFEQSIFAEAPIFEYVPILNKMYILEGAKFRFGYTYILAGSVARPYDTIVWQANPVEGLFPSINLKRGAWSTSNFSFAIDWWY